MSPEQIAWARAVAEESYDGQLIRDLCNALDRAWDDGYCSGALDGVLLDRRTSNPYRDAA